MLLDEEPLVLAIDPGRGKCGLAVVSPSGKVRHREVVSRLGLRERVEECCRRYAPEAIVVGGGTGAKAVLAEVQRLGLPCVLVEERNTTWEARRRYFQAHPPQGWRRWLPKGLLLPPEPYDDWAAVLLAERYWAGRKKSREGEK